MYLGKKVLARPLQLIPGYETIPGCEAGRFFTNPEDDMAETFKGKAEEAGHKIAEKATEVGHRVGEKMEEATDWVKQKAHQMGNRIEEATQKAEHKAHEVFGESGTTAAIREHMDVVGSCGNKLGKVDHVEGSTIKLTKNDSPDGQHHFIPASWVARVDDRVHLVKSCGDAKQEWKTE
jgi:hypothetical protein